MKICKIHFENHNFFGNLDIDLTDPQGNPLNTVVFAGINGSGKTSILVSIFSMFNTLMVKLEGESLLLCDYSENEDRKSFIKIQLNTEEKNIYQQCCLEDEKDFDSFTSAVSRFGGRFNEYPEDKKKLIRKFSKCIYLPTEIKFKDIVIKNTPFEYNYNFYNIIDEKITENIPNYFGTYIDKMIYSNQDVLPKDSIKKACGEINSIFEILDLESRLFGLKTDGSRMPVFVNKSGKEFEIDGLSSGEKQLFFRIMALKMVEANNSIILVDEPEISLHPAWQQKILKVYENVGENNQIIVATHSPHIIGSTAKENVKLLTRDDESKRFKVLNYDVPTKGALTERILEDLMGLKTTRDPEIQGKIDNLWNQIKESKYDSDEFKKEYSIMENLLSSMDEDLVLMRMEIGKRKWEKSNAKN